MYQTLVRERRATLLAEAEHTRLVRDALAVRPIAPDDTARLHRLFGRLSPHSIYLRFFSPIHRLTDEQLHRLADVDHACREALVAVRAGEIIAVARYDAERGSREAEISLTVEDAWQRHGVGTRLARRLGKLAADRGFETFVARILPENRAALGFVRTLAPKASISCTRDECQAVIPLSSM